MKKLGMMALAALLVVAFTLPAYALETEFRGYWRTRFFTNQNFTGEDETEAQDVSKVDTRTRFRFTTIFHENLKWVNRFEFDSTWGDDPLGDLGADGKELEIKNSFADFNVGPVNAKVGIQGFRLGRGFIMDNDAAGAVVTFKGSNFSIPLIWIRPTEGSEQGFIDDNDQDLDFYAIAPSFKAGGVNINPYVFYAYSEDAGLFAENETLASPAEQAVLPNTEELNIWYAGADIDFSFDPVSFWLTGIYQGGDADLIGGGSVDFEGYLGAAGASVGMGFGEIHAEAFYASGDDDNDGDIETFFVPGLTESYYWAEIMGYGVFDDQVSNNAPADQIYNIMAANFGLTLNPMDKLEVGMDVWYAQLVEEITLPDGSKEDYLGTEVDLRITYELVDNLNLDVIGAYLFAGDATTENSPNDADPYEVGARLSLSF
ncbi:MAG: alginate export family protein [Thermodesulfobacteriota bacterium]